MMRKTDKEFIFRRPDAGSGVLTMVIPVLLIVLMILMSSGSVYAAKEAKEKKDVNGDKPIREVHQVKVGDTKYCFFVTHNVVLTPEDVSEMSDDELTAEILQQSGLYIRKTNCRKPSHGIITVNQFSRKDKEIFLSEDDLNEIRMAEPVDGEPVKLHMDLRIIDGTEDAKKDKDKDKDKEKDKIGDNDGTDGEDSDQPDGEEEGEEEEEEEDLPDNVYSTFKRTSPRILFMAIATPTDAAYGEDICVEDKKKDNGKEKDFPDGPDKDEKEMLPEFRTINMTDRSGGPLEDTLKDGDPFSLEWIEPAKQQGDGQGSLIDRIPGGMAGLAFIAVLILAAFATAVYAAIRHKRRIASEEES